MNDNVFDNQTLSEDNLNINADQQATTPPQEDKVLLAGKFQDRDKLEKSTVELFRKVEGKDPTPSEKLAFKNMPDEVLEGFYKEIESDFTRLRQQGELAVEEDEETMQMKQALKNLGFVSRDELDKQKYEQEQIDLYLAQDPTAKDRLNLIQVLKDTNEFANKSIPEIDMFIKENAGLRPATGGKAPSKPTQLGDNMNAKPTNPVDMSDEQFMQLFG